MEPEATRQLVLLYANGQTTSFLVYKDNDLSYVLSCKDLYHVKGLKRFKKVSN